MRFTLTPTFKREASKILTDNELAGLIQYLANNPEQGDIIKGSGGFRKLRWSYGSKGKSGGSRIIYFYRIDDLIFLTDIYKKNEKENLSQEEINKLKNLKENFLTTH